MKLLLSRPVGKGTFNIKFYFPRRENSWCFYPFGFRMACCHQGKDPRLTPWRAFWCELMILNFEIGYNRVK